MSSKKPGKARKTRSSKPTLKKATVKDLAPSRGGSRGAKGGAVIMAWPHKYDAGSGTCRA